MAAPGENLRINPDRLWDSIHELAEIGPGIAGGNNRQTLTDDDKKGRELFKRWCDGAGLTMGVDQMGTMFMRREGTDPELDPVFVGSHLDTQPTGGRYDGVLGVLSGLEIIRTLNDLGIRTKRPIVVVNWTNEEGARFAPAMMASGVFAGQFTPGLRLWAQGHGRQDLRRRAQAHRLGRRREGRRAQIPRLFRVPHRAGADPRSREQADRRRHARPGPVVAGIHADRQGSAYRLDADEHARQCRARDGAHLRDGPDGGDGEPAGRGRRRRADAVLAQFAQRAAGQGGVHRRYPLAGAGEARPHAGAGSRPRRRRSARRSG